MMEWDYSPVIVDGQYRGGLVLLWDISDRTAREQERDRRLEAELASRGAAERARQQLAEQNDELRELDELKTRFLATVSHELRSPLTSIVSYAELIRDEGGCPRSRLATWTSSRVTLTGSPSSSVTCCYSGRSRPA